LYRLIRQNKTGIKHDIKKKNKHRENVIVSDWQEILYKDIQDIHLIINSIMLSIKWSQGVIVV
jgi:hypothetical protein